MTNDYKIIKENHHWTSEEKLKYCGYGEWIEEADVTEIEYLGYEAFIIRVFIREYLTKEEAYSGGYLCGYVRIPENHPLYKQKEIVLDCHGGVTFNEIHEEHWIGFDCAHPRDIVPTIENFKNTNEELISLQKEIFSPVYESLFKQTYKNIEFCIEECKSMIAQLVILEEKKIESKKNE